MLEDHAALKKGADFSRIRAVVFDKDGTFVDFERTWVPTLHQTIEALAGGDAHACARLHKLALYDAQTGVLSPRSPFLCDASADFAPQWAAALGREDDRAFLAELDGWMARFALEFIAPLGRPERVFVRLKRAGLRIGVLTNDAEKPAQDQCAALGLSQFIDRVIGYDSGFKRKPSPEPLAEMLRGFALAPFEAVMVGDSAHDMACARAAGVFAIGLAPEHDGAQFALPAPYADTIVPDIAALPAFLGV